MGVKIPTGGQINPIKAERVLVLWRAAVDPDIEEIAKSAGVGLGTLLQILKAGGIVPPRRFPFARTGPREPYRPRQAPDLGTLGGRVRAARQAAGLTLQVLSVAASVSLGTLAAIETGRHLPRRATLERIAAVMGIEVTKLVNPKIAIPR